MRERKGGGEDRRERWGEDRRERHKDLALKRWEREKRERSKLHVRSNKQN